MRVDEMIQAVRDQAVEFDHDPVSDDAILRRLSFAYSYAYNHFVKSNDSLFARWYYVTLKAGISRYPLPRFLWGKRVEALEVPTPANSGYEPYSYIPILRVDPQAFSRYDAPRARTFMPLAWTQVRNELWVAPPPLGADKAKYLATPGLIPLGLVEGVIVDFQGDTLYLDRAPTPLLSQNLTRQSQNVISICDGITGEIKRVYPYDAVNGTEIKLGSATTRTTIRDQDVTRCYAHAAYRLDFDPATRLLTATFTTPVVGVTLGDYVEVTLSATAGAGYNIEDSGESDADFYDPPEFEMPSSGFSRGGKVMALGSHSITWLDETVTPAFVDGYPLPDGASIAGTVAAVAEGRYLDQDVVLVTTDLPHDIPEGQVVKVTFTLPGTDAEGVRKVVAADATTLVIFKPTLTGTYAGAGTFSLYQYGSGVVVTGFPLLRELAPGTPSLPTVQVTVKSPFTFSLISERNNNNPEAYDHANDVQIDDVVCWGCATGVPIIPEAYHEALVQYAVLSLKSSLNETDNEVAALLKELFTSMKGDTAGRKLGGRIQREFGIRSNHLLQSRRLGRR